MKTILVQKNAHGRTKFIELELELDVVKRIWGLVDGKTQETSNKYDFINKGKANELLPKEAALADYIRIIETKVKEGYILVDAIDSIPELDDKNIDFDNLPVQLCCSKPHSSSSEKKIDTLIAEQKARFFVKENGSCCFLLVCPDGEVKIYSRRINNHTKKYTKIAAALKDIGLPPKTLLIAEFTVDSSDLCVTHMDRFKRFQEISKADTLKGEVKENVDETMLRQKDTPVVAVVFNILFLGGEDLTNKPYADVHATMLDIESYDTSGFIRTPTEKQFVSYKEAYTWAKDNLDMEEGLVVWNQVENAEISYTGKPKRRACYKLKAVREDDLIAYGWEEGKGKKQGKIGSLLIGKYSEDLSEIIPMGNVGSGLKIKQGECDIDYWEFPCVIQIEHAQRFPTKHYQFPVFIKRHEDKLPKDVVVNDEGF